MKLLNGAGRPSTVETKRRTRRLLELVAAGESLPEAARKACVKPDRVLRLMADPVFRQTLCGLLDGPAKAAA